MEVKSIASVIPNYVKLLKKQKEIKEQFDAENAKIEALREKMEAWLLDQGQEVEEVPEELKEISPYLAWKLQPKTDGSAIETHMAIDDGLIPELENSVSAKVKILKEQLEEVENWALRRMVENDLSNFTKKGVGRCQKETIIRYSIADKKLLVGWAKDSGNEDLLSITIRPNSKVMSEIVAEEGEIPPGVSSTSLYKAKFVKG